MKKMNDINYFNEDNTINIEGIIDKHIRIQVKSFTSDDIFTEIKKIYDMISKKFEDEWDKTNQFNKDVFYRYFANDGKKSELYAKTKSIIDFKLEQAFQSKQLEQISKGRFRIVK